MPETLTTTTTTTTAAAATTMPPPPSSRSKAKHPPPSSTCNHSPSAPIDLILLILVISSSIFLISSSLSHILRSLSSFLFPPSSSVLLLLLLFSSFFLLLLLLLLSLRICCSRRRCSNPKCRGLKKALEFDVQVQTEDCIRDKGKEWKEIEDLPWKGGQMGKNPDYELLRAELRKMAPVNGRAVLLFRARCGCPVAKLEAWGPKKGRQRYKRSGANLVIGGSGAWQA